MVEFETSGDKLGFARDLIHLFQNRDDNVFATYSPSTGKPVPVRVDDPVRAVYFHLFGTEPYLGFHHGSLATGFYGNELSEHRFLTSRLGIYSTDIDSLTLWGVIDLDGEGHEWQLLHIDEVLIGIILKAQKAGIKIHLEVNLPKNIGQFNLSGYNPDKEYDHGKTKFLHRRV